MKTNTRRKFIRNTSLTATGLFLTSVSVAKKETSVSSALGCAPTKTLQLTGTVTSVKSGNWSDPATWGGKVPAATDTPLIASGHTVTVDQDLISVAGININNGAILSYGNTKTVTIESSKNVVVNGTLEMKPASANYIHTLRFVGINEDRMLGGGMGVLDSDTGLWVMGAGNLNLVGTEKKAWTNLQGSAASGASSFSLKAANGWAAGDEIVICPTQSITGLDQFDVSNLFERKNIKSVSGTTVNIESSLSFNHLKVEPAGSNKSWTAEVLNLTRNVRIEGTEKGRSHILITSSSPQTLKYVALRYMGPRKDQTGDGIKDLLRGRYALHFHHSMDGSRGSVVQDCVSYDMGSHSFVPHVSHGILFKNCVAFNTLETPYWWDFQDVTHDTIYEGCVAALSMFVNGSKDITSPDSSAPTRNSSSFQLGMGDGNVCNNCISVGGALGYPNVDPHQLGAFTWDANNEGVWEFENNLAHSNICGLKVWQNTHRNHTIVRYDSYNNGLAMFHGAYMNSYTYRYGYHYNSQVDIKATSSNSSGVRFEHIVFDGANNMDYTITIYDSPVQTINLHSSNTNKFLYCTMKNYRKGPLLGSSTHTPNSNGTSSEFRKIKLVDVIHCNLGAALPTYDSLAENGCWTRVQPLSGPCKKIEKVGQADSSNGSVKVTDIERFAPAVWGEGDGLLAEYYNNTKELESSKKVLTRVDSILMFNQWTPKPTLNPTGVYYKITGDLYSIRWSGKIMAQYSEEYTFRCNGSGGFKLWINGVLINDAWTETFDNTDRFARLSKPIKLVAGQLYDFKVEHFNAGGYRGCLLYWKCPSMIGYEIVPQSQLFSKELGGSSDQETINQPPVANAGVDIALTLPTNSTTLDGTASTDGDDGIASYKWSLVSGPSQYSLANANAAKTALSNLEQGTYVFQLEVKDKAGATATGEVMVTVNSANNQAPKADAGTDMVIILPTNSATLDGSASKDSDGSIASYKWSKVSGPAQLIITSPSAVTTSVSNLVKGEYVFRLQVTDNKGATATDDVTVTVNEGTASNKPPVANAGRDITITQPTDKTTLDGSASKDPVGSITSYQWRKVSGPSQFSLDNASKATTALTSLVEGTYVFRLKVTNNKGLTATDEVTVFVKPKPENDKPNQEENLSMTVSASPNPSPDVFNIHVNSNSDLPITLTLFDRWGKEVAIRRNVRRGSTVVIPSTLKRGTYYGVAEQGFQKRTMTLVKL